MLHVCPVRTLPPVYVCFQSDILSLHYRIEVLGYNSECFYDMDMTRSRDSNAVFVPLTQPGMRTRYVDFAAPQYQMLILSVVQHRREPDADDCKADEVIGASGEFLWEAYSILDTQTDIRYPWKLTSNPTHSNLLSFPSWDDRPPDTTTSTSTIATRKKTVQPLVISLRVSQRHLSVVGRAKPLIRSMTFPGRTQTKSVSRMGW